MLTFQISLRQLLRINGQADIIAVMLVNVLRCIFGLGMPSLAASKKAHNSGGVRRNS
jgi:hypothetical protein